MTDPVVVPSPVRDFHALEDLDKAIDSFLILLAGELKGGFTVVKIVDLITKLALDPVYSNLVKDYKDFLPEFKALDLSEGMSLLVLLLTGIPRWIEAFKAKALSGIV